MPRGSSTYEKITNMVVTEMVKRKEKGAVIDISIGKDKYHKEVMVSVV